MFAGNKAYLKKKHKIANSQRLSQLSFTGTIEIYKITQGAAWHRA
jgi:hypothetical protein